VRAAPGGVAVEHAVLGALLGLLGAVALSFLWASRAWPLIHDAPILHYIAWRISEGAVPYRDLFDMNQPGAYLVHLAVVTLLGDGDLAWRVTDLSALVAGALALSALARPWGPVAAGGAALLFAVYHLTSGAWHAGQRDFLLVPWLVIGVLGVARARETLAECRVRAALGHVAVGGLALGVGITMKPHAAVLAAALAAFLITVPPRTPRARLGALGLYLGAVAVPPAAVLGWLAWVGALSAWWDIVRHYLVPLYSALTRPADWGLYRWHHWIPLAGAVLLSLGSLVAARRVSARHVAALLGLAYGVVHFVGQRKGWEYHLYPLAAFAIVLGFSEVDRLVRARAWAVAAPLVAALAVTTALLGVKGMEAVHADWVADKEHVVRELVADLGPRLGPGDTVQVLDTTEGGIHALLRLKRALPTRFLYDFHFQHHVADPTIQRLRAELVHALRAHPPRAVVAFARGWPDGSYERHRRFPELADLLATSYHVVETRAAYVILAKRDGR
jgi:hypothetical protein